MFNVSHVENIFVVEEERMVEIACRVAIVLAYFIRKYLKKELVNEFVDKVSTQPTFMYNWARSFGLGFVILTKVTRRVPVKAGSPDKVKVNNPIEVFNYRDAYD